MNNKHTNREQAPANASPVVVQNRTLNQPEICIHGIETILQIGIAAATDRKALLEIRDMCWWLATRNLNRPEPISLKIAEDYLNQVNACQSVLDGFPGVQACMI